MTERPLQWVTVPKGTPESKCRAAECRAPIYWVEQRSTARRFANVSENKRPTVRIPVDCSVEGGSDPGSLTDGKGVNHFQTCCAAEDFTS